MASVWKVINLGTTPLTGGGVTATADVDVSSTAQITIYGRIGNATTPATASGDISVSISLYEDDGVTPVPPNGNAFMIADFTPRAASLTSPYAYQIVRFNVAGYNKVKVQVQNNNAAALQGATAVVYVAAPGIN